MKNYTYTYNGPAYNDLKKSLSAKYWDYWNDDVQAEIDANIEKNRKADGMFEVEGIPANAEVKIEQISHEFYFGAQIFNFDQLGDDECNARYRDLYGSLFNSATVAFYWREFEMEEGKPRFEGAYRDTAEFWKNCKDPKHEPHWRRPSPGPIVDYCESRGVRVHGHTLVWGNNRWQWPEWLINTIPFRLLKEIDFSPRNPDLGEERIKDAVLGAIFEKYTPEQIENKYPGFVAELNLAITKRLVEIATYYGDRITSWDVVNESATDFGRGLQVRDRKLCGSHYGPMPGDYTYKAFKIAEAFFPSRVKLNINDYRVGEEFTSQVADLIERKCKIDVLGAQMHIFDQNLSLDIADGKSDQKCPAHMYETFNGFAKLDRPVHLSEITITAPNNDERGQAIQAVMTHNFYRLWFSIEKMCGITWWNVVDDCGAPGEPSVSGLFTRDMQPKPAYFVLNDLIHKAWKTNTAVVAKNGKVAFRGFCGNYKLSWKNADGVEVSKEVTLTKGQ